MDYDAYIKEPLPFIEDLRRFFSKKDNLIIFEIGSCEGEDTIRMKRAFPNSTIYTFEALPKNVRIIKDNLKRYGLETDKVFGLALSNKKGHSDFYVSSGHPENLPKTQNWDYGNKSSSLLPPKEHKRVLKWIKFKDKIKVQTDRLDNFCKSHGISNIDFIYLDVQGAELMVLGGAGDFIGKIGAIWMEVEAVELYKGQPLKNDVERFMKKNGFKRIRDTVNDVSGDQLYVNEGLSPRNKFISRLKMLIGGSQ